MDTFKYRNLKKEKKNKKKPNRSVWKELFEYKS